MNKFEAEKIFDLIWRISYVAGLVEAGPGSTTPLQYCAYLNALGADF
jgi:hypothetical protein